MKQLKQLISSAFFPYLLISLTCASLYFKTIHFDFSYYDDNILILNNKYFISNINNIPTTFLKEVFFTIQTQAFYYRPLLITSFILDAQPFGISPIMFHATNILLHTIASLLVYTLLRKLNTPKHTSLLLTLIFSLHPTLTQAVAWIPGRNDPLLAIFVIPSFIFFINFTKNNSKKHLLIHLFFLFSALLTKETAAITIPLCIIYTFLLVKNTPSKTIIFSTLSSWIMISLAYLYLRGLPTIINSTTTPLLTKLSGIIDHSMIYIHYLGKIFFPFNLSVLPIIQNISNLPGIIAIILIITLLLTSKQLNNKKIIFASLWFILFILPTTLHQINKNSSYSFVELEHRLYIPIIGILLILSEINIIKNINLKNPKTLILTTTFLTSSLLLSSLHLNNFKNGLTFWQNAVITSPNHPSAHNGLGIIHLNNNNLSKAKHHLLNTLKLDKNNALAHSNMGLIYTKQGLFNKAIQEYKLALDFKKTSNTYFNLGIAYFKLNNLELAIKNWEETIYLNPEHINALNNLAKYHINIKDFKKAAIYIHELEKRGINVTTNTTSK